MADARASVRVRCHCDASDVFSLYDRFSDRLNRYIFIINICCSTVLEIQCCLASSLMEYKKVTMIFPFEVISFIINYI